MNCYYCGSEKAHPSLWGTWNDNGEFENMPLCDQCLLELESSLVSIEKQTKRTP